MNGLSTKIFVKMWASDVGAGYGGEQLREAHSHLKGVSAAVEGRRLIEARGGRV